jgi:hypothetical protein
MTGAIYETRAARGRVLFDQESARKRERRIDALFRQWPRLNKAEFAELRRLWEMHLTALGVPKDRQARIERKEVEERV